MLLRTTYLVAGRPVGVASAVAVAATILRIESNQKTGTYTVISLHQEPA